MKVVIDISEDMYKDADILIAKDLPELKKIIANGTPILTDEIYKKGFKDGWNRLWIEMKKLDCNEEEGGNVRPQGEWEFKKFDEKTGIMNSDWCPFCGKSKAQVYDKFCGNCGAQLKR